MDKLTNSSASKVWQRLQCPRGPELLRLAAGVYQVIWGDFEAYRLGQERFWLVVRAIDSTLYVVITEDRQLLERVRSRFTDVRHSLEEADYPL